MIEPAEASPARETQEEAAAIIQARKTIQAAADHGDWSAAAWLVEWTFPDGYGGWHAACGPHGESRNPTLPESREAHDAAEFISARQPLRCRYCNRPLCT